MGNEELKGKILEMIKQPQLASVATINEGDPWVRYMVVQGDETLSLYTSTFAQSRKVEQINKNNNVDLIVGGDLDNLKKSYMNIKATASILTDIETKKQCWHEKLGNYFTGPEDPNFAVIKMVPQTIEYTAAGTHMPEVYEVG